MTRQHETEPDAGRAGRARRRRFLRWVKRGVAGSAALALIGAAAIALLPDPIPVDVALAKRGPMEVTVDEDGKTRVVDRYVVSAPITGNIPRLALREGDPVEEGAVLVRLAATAPPLLDTRARAEAEARLAAALAGQRQVIAEVARARAASDLASSDARRQRELADKRAVPVATAETAEHVARARAEELRSAEFGAKVAAHQVESARAALGILAGRSRTEPSLDLFAPVSGKVLRVVRKDEGLVAAGSPLVELGDPWSLEIVVDVLTRDAVHVAPGQEVRIHQWGGAPLAARVQRVEPSAFTRISSLGVEEQRVNVVIRLESERGAWQALGDGFRVEAAIVTWRGDDVLMVPASAAFRRGNEWAVYAVRDGMARATPVDVGRRNAHQVEILKGIEPGTQVVLHPSDRLSDGVEVVPR